MKVEVLKTRSERRTHKELVRYECEPGIFVEGYILRRIDARDGRKRPGIVAFHQTTKDTIDEIAGVSGPREMWIGETLAQSGFVVFCPRCFLWQDAADYNEAVATYNTYIRQFPQVMTAKVIGADRRDTFEAPAGASDAPQVEFD